MPKMIDGSIACRIGLAPEWTGKKLYCDFCKEFFDSREELPCEVPQAKVELTPENPEEKKKRKIEKWRNVKRSG